MAQRAPGNPIRRLATARRTTGWASPKYDIGPAIVTGFLSGAASWWVSLRGVEDVETVEWLVPAAVGIGGAIAYWVVVNFAEFCWRFVEAGARNALDDYQEGISRAEIAKAQSLGTFTIEPVSASPAGRSTGYTDMEQEPRIARLRFTADREVGTCSALVRRVNSVTANQKTGTYQIAKLRHDDDVRLQRDSGADTAPMIAGEPRVAAVAVAGGNEEYNYWYLARASGYVGHHYGPKQTYKIDIEVFGTGMEPREVSCGLRFRYIPAFGAEITFRLWEEVADEWLAEIAP